MVNDPIGDMLIQIKNASLARRSVVELPYSKVKQRLAQILVREGYIASAKKVGFPPKYQLRITLRYREKSPSITNVARVSKPGLRVYVGAKSIPYVVGGLGIAIVSTPAGILTGKEARKRGLGGELLCQVW